jgi:hypothetical protein
MWVFIPALRQPPCFDFFVLLAGIALLGNRDESRIDDLATAGLEALGAEVGLKHLETLLDNFRLAQSLSEEGDCGGIWNAVHHTKPDKLLKGAPVIHLEFKLFIAEVEKLLENEHLEKDQRINPLAPCIVLALLHIALVKQWAELFPGD